MFLDLNDTPEWYPIAMICRSLLTVVLATSSLPAANNPFVGTWKVNHDKDVSTPRTLTIKVLGDERYTFGSGERAHGVIADGKPYPSPTTKGMMITLTKVDASTWKETAPGYYSVTYHLKDEHTLELLSSTKDVSSRTEFERSEGRSDLQGPWKQKGKSERLSGPVETITIKPASGDALSITFSQLNAHYIMTFDGQQYTVEGDWPKDLKTAGTAKRIDENTILETRFSNGKEYEKAELKVSPDGRTLAERSSTKSQHDERVYERQ